MTPKPPPPPSPCLGTQWNLTSVSLPALLSSRKVWTPKPGMKRYDLGMPTSSKRNVSCGGFGGRASVGIWCERYYLWCVDAMQEYADSRVTHVQPHHVAAPLPSLPHHMHPPPLTPSHLTMWQLSGWCDRKSMMRHASCWWFLGLGLKAWITSGNLMPSRMKKTWRRRGGGPYHQFDPPTDPAPPPFPPPGCVSHRHVVSDHVEVALPCVELDGETPGVAQGLCKGGRQRGSRAMSL